MNESGDGELLISVAPTAELNLNLFKDSNPVFFLLWYPIRLAMKSHPDPTGRFTDIN